MRGLMRSGRLWRHDDVDATRRLLDHLLLEGQAYGRLRWEVLAPVCVHLHAEDEVEEQGEREAGGDDDVANLGGGGEEARGAATDLGEHGEGGELAGAARTMVLGDLRKLGEEGERERGELKESEESGRCCD